MRVVLGSWTGTALERPRAVLILLTALSAAAALSSALLKPEEWVGWFPSTMAAAEQGAVWPSLVVSGAAAWISGQARAHGMLEWSSSSPRGAASRLAPTLLLVGTAVLVAQAAASMALLAVSRSYGLTAARGGLDLFLLVPTVTAYLLFWTAVGALLGRSVPRQVALPLAALLPYAAYAVLALYSGDGPLASLAIADGRLQDYLRPSASTVVTRLVFWALAALALWASSLAREGAQHRIRRWGAGAVALVAMLAFAQGATFLPIAGATSAVCAGARPVTCLDMSHAAVMTRYRQQIDRLWPSVPAALRPAVIGSHQEVTAGRSGRTLLAPPVRGYTEPACVIDGQMFAARFGDELFLTPCRETGRISETAVSLVLWWRLQHGVPFDGSAFAGDTPYSAVDPDYKTRKREAVAFTALPTDKREAWFRENAAEVLDCTAPGLASS